MSFDQEKISVSTIAERVSLGYYEEALDDLEILLSAYKDVWSITYLLGVCCFAIGQYPKAKDFFQKAQRIRPDSSLTTHALASTLIRLGQLHEGLFQYKISLTQPEESIENFSPFFLDFYQSLAEWKLDSGLLSAESSWEKGKVLHAVETLEHFGEVRDPQPDELILLFNWYMYLNRYEDALNKSVELLDRYGPKPEYYLFASKALGILGEKEALKEAVSNVLVTKDYRLQLEAISLLKMFSLLTEEEVFRKLEDWQFDSYLPEKSISVERDNLLQENCSISIGILLSNFHENSPAIWFIECLNYLFYADAHCTIYTYNTNYWGKEKIDQYGFDVVEVDRMDDLTFKTIISRNKHHCLWDLSSANKDSMIHRLKDLDIFKVCFVEGNMPILKNEQKVGYDIVVSTNNGLEEKTGQRKINFLDIFLMPNRFEAQLKTLETSGFVIGIAIRPHHILTAQKFISDTLLLSESIYLSLDQAILSDRGQEMIMRGLENNPELGRRIVLFDRSLDANTNTIENHLKSVDLFISFGIPEYDYCALKNSIPSICFPEASYEDQGLMRHLLDSFSEGTWQPKTTETLNLNLASWINNEDAWREIQDEFLTNIDNITSPNRNIDTIYRWFNTLCP